jgi:hypothetical protein
MKPVRWAILLYLAAPLLIGFGAGCGNFWQAPTTTTGTGGGGCTTNCTTDTSGNFYILDSGTNPGIVGDFINAGSLTAISGSPWIVQGVPYSMAIAPNGDFLVVSSTSGVFSFPITNGVLGTAVTISSVEAFAVQVDTTSSWVLEAIPGTAGVEIDAVPVNNTTGASPGNAQIGTYTDTNGAVQANQMVISGDDANIFVAMGAGGTIIVPFNESAGAKGDNPLSSSGTIIKVANTGGTALSVAVDPVTTANTTPRLFYVGESLGNSAGNSGGLRIFNYSSLGTSALTQASGSPIASGGLAPNYVLPEASGAYVYVANGQGTSAGSVNGFTITASSATTPVYTIATDTSTAAGEQPLGMAEDSSGQFVFEVGSAGSPYFDAYTFDATSLGQLDSQFVATAAGNSLAIVAAPQ